MSILYRVRHETRFRYDAPVSQCQSEVRLTPRSLPWQTVLESKIETTPAAAWFDSRKDYFGNNVSAFWIRERHDRFSTVATSRVRVEHRPAITTAGMPWEDAREALAEHANPDTRRRRRDRRAASRRTRIRASRPDVRCSPLSKNCRTAFTRSSPTSRRRPRSTHRCSIRCV